MSNAKTPARVKEVDADFEQDIEREDVCAFVYSVICGDAQCTRDWWCAKGSKCARVRDTVLCCDALVRVFWTTAEREVAKYTDELERKEFLGTLTDDERRALKRRREEALKYVRARAFAEAPQEQLMSRRTDFLAKSAMSSSTRPQSMRTHGGRGQFLNRHDDHAPAEVSDEYTTDSDDDDDDDSYWSDEYSDGYDDIEREFQENQRQRAAAPRNWNEKLIVGRDLAFAGEGELGDGLRRWEDYIAAARVADGLLEIKIDTQLEAFERELEAKLEDMRVQGMRAKWSDLDMRIRRTALVAEHDARVNEILERERALREKTTKREKLASLDATKRAKLLRIWQQHADATRDVGG